MQTTNPFGVDPIRLFGDYMKVTGVPTLPAGCVLPFPTPYLCDARLHVRPRMSVTVRVSSCLFLPKSSKKDEAVTKR